MGGLTFSRVESQIIFGENGKLLNNSAKNKYPNLVSMDQYAISS